MAGVAADAGTRVSIEIDHPWVLLLLPLCLLPLLAGSAASIRFSSFLLVPDDRLSRLVDAALKGAAVAIIALVVLGLAGPFLPATQVERIGEGAQIVLLLDRSRSMDESFGGARSNLPLGVRRLESKGTVARRVLSRFVAARRNDQYAMLVFSKQPIQVLPLTNRSEPIQAAIRAGNVGRGLSDTDVGRGIVAAAKLFDDQPYTGSRLVLLISDGGARLDLATRQRIEGLLKQNRVALYWIYISSRFAPAIGTSNGQALSEEFAPARTLHAFFQTLETPYRLFNAEDPDALATAVSEVNRLQSLPISVFDIVPRKQVAGVFFSIALVLLLALVLVELLERREWAGEPSTR